MKKVAILVVVGLLLGCVTPPQTVNEFREGVKLGGMMTKMDHREVNRPLGDVFQDVKRNSDWCLNVVVTASTPGRYGPVRESVPYHAKSRMTGKAKGEMVMQMAKRATGKMPEGGYFVLVADMEAVSASRTRVTIYGPSIGYGNVFEAIFDWANGKNRECPRLF